MIPLRLYSKNRIYLLLIVGLFIAVLFLGAIMALSNTVGLGFSILLILMILTIGFLARPVWICYVAVFFIPLISGMPRNVLIPFLRPNEPLLLGLFALMVLRGLLQLPERERIRLTPVDKTFIVLFLGSSIVPFLIYIFRKDFPDMAGIFVYLSLIQYFIFYRIIIGTVRTEREISNVIKVFLLSGLVVTVVGILEAIKFPGIQQFLIAFYPSGHLTVTLDRTYRIVSILGNWHALAAFTVLQVLVAVIFWFMGKEYIQSWLLKLSTLSGLVAFVPVVALTGLVGMGTMILSLFVLIRPSWKLILIIMVVILIAAILFWPFIQNRIGEQFGESDSIWPKTGLGRVKLWKYVFWPLIKDNLVFGYGPTIPENATWKHYESQYVALMFTGGLVALLAHFYFVLANAKWLYRSFRSYTDVRKLTALCALLMLIIMSVMGLANVIFIYSAVAESLWLFLGLTAIKIPPRVSHPVKS